MSEREFDKEAYARQHLSRVKSGVIVEVNPDVISAMREAIQAGNPFIREGDRFIVMGFDGFEGRWFPAGSFRNKGKALKYEGQKRSEEHLYSDGSGISTTFHTFTNEGFQVKHKPGNK